MSDGLTAPEKRSPNKGFAGGMRAAAQGKEIRKPIKGPRPFGINEAGSPHRDFGDGLSSAAKGQGGVRVKEDPGRDFGIKDLQSHKKKLGSEKATIKGLGAKDKPTTDSAIRKDSLKKSVQAQSQKRFPSREIQHATSGPKGKPGAFMPPAKKPKQTQATKDYLGTLSKGHKGKRAPQAGPYGVSSQTSVRAPARTTSMGRGFGAGQQASMAAAGMNEVARIWGDGVEE